MEQWRDVIGYDGLYRVSDQGRVFSTGQGHHNKKDGILKPDCTSAYPRIKLQRNGVKVRKFIHVLVAEAFIGPCPEGEEVNHKDGNKMNPNFDNLEYGTRSYNQWHCNHVIKTRTPQQGSAHGRSKINEETAIAIRAAREAGEPIARVAERFNVSQGTVSMICTGKIWKHVVPNHRTVPRFRV
jgi:hypothetical protein